MKNKSTDYVTCFLCKSDFRRITNTHLWIAHRYTWDEYKNKYPKADMEAADLRASRSKATRGKTYEVIYGVSKANQLRTIRKNDAVKQMQDPKQIAVRRDKCGYEHTPEIDNRNREAHTKHGGSNYRERAIAYYGKECARCGYNSIKESDFHVHHKNLINIRVETADHQLSNLQVLCRSCHIKLHNELQRTQRQFLGIKEIEKGVHHLLKGLKFGMGLDLRGDNFKDTPKRVSRAWVEIFEGVKNTKEKLDYILSTSFPSKYNEMIMAANIRVFSMCPHHLLPVDYRISVGYLPTLKGKVIGVSKLTRLVEILAKRPVIQEQLVDDITEALMSINGCRGAGCTAVGKHYCMIMRGIKIDSPIKTTSLKGVFLKKQSVKEEFLNGTAPLLWQIP